MKSIALWIVSIFLLFGCFSPYSPELSEKVSECLTLDDTIKDAYHGHCGCSFPKAECLMDLGIEYESPSVCNELQEEVGSCGCPVDYKYPARDRCFYQVAERIHDTNACNQISDLELKADCLEVVGED